MRIFDVSKSSYVPRIRIINLVDILFILLLFFIATTTFRFEAPSAVKLALPEARNVEDLGKEKVHRLLVTVGPDETIYLGEQRVDLPSLERALSAAKTEDPNVVLQFSADKKVSYGEVVAIMDAARAAGIHNVTAFTKKSVKPSAEDLPK